MIEIFRIYFPPIYDALIFFKKIRYLVFILGYLIYAGLLGYLIYKEKYLILVGLLGFLGFLGRLHKSKQTEKK